MVERISAAFIQAANINNLKAGLKKMEQLKNEHLAYTLMLVVFNNYFFMAISK